MNAPVSDEQVELGVGNEEIISGPSGRELEQRGTAACLSMMALVTGVIVIVFGTLTLVLHDETFIKVKPTIIYGLFAAILGGGLLFGPLLHRHHVRHQMFNLTPQGWRILTMRWALFFFAMAILNEIIWRTQSTDFWVGFKAFRRDSADDDGFCDHADAADPALSPGAASLEASEGGSRGCQERVSLGVTSCAALLPRPALAGSRRAKLALGGLG